MTIKRHSWNTAFTLYVLWEEEAHCIAHNFFLCNGKFSIFLNEEYLVKV